MGIIALVDYGDLLLRSLLDELVLDSLLLLLLGLDERRVLAGGLRGRLELKLLGLELLSYSVLRYDLGLLLLLLLLRLRLLDSRLDLLQLQLLLLLIQQGVSHYNHSERDANGKLVQGCILIVHCYFKNTILKILAKEYVLLISNILISYINNTTNREFV